MGSGGVGGYFGARLVKGGADVHFIARGSHLAAMREHGLAVEGGPEPIHLPKVNVTDDPKTIGPVDMVMFCVKLWDTETAARPLLPIMRPRDRHHLVPERRDQGRHAAADLRRRGAARRRRLCRDRDRPAGRDRADRSAAAAGVRRIRRPPFAAGRGVLRRPASAAASMPRSATMSAARCGRNTWCWSPCPAPPPPCARTIGPIRTNPLTRAVPARPRARGRRRRPRPRRRSARRLRRAAHPVLRRLAARNDDLDAPRSAARQAARGALALRRRGRSRRRGRRADADEPRRARYFDTARGGRRGT